MKTPIGNIKPRFAHAFSNVIFLHKKVTVPTHFNFNNIYSSIKHIKFDRKYTISCFLLTLGLIAIPIFLNSYTNNIVNGNKVSAEGTVLNAQTSDCPDNSKIIKIGDSLTNNAAYLPGSENFGVNGVGIDYFVSGDGKDMIKRITNGEFCGTKKYAVVMLGTNEVCRDNADDFISRYTNLLATIGGSYCGNPDDNLKVIVLTFPKWDVAMAKSSFGGSLNVDGCVASMPSYIDAINGLEGDYTVVDIYNNVNISDLGMTDGIHFSNYAPINNLVYQEINSSCQDDGTVIPGTDDNDKCDKAGGNTAWMVTSSGMGYVKASEWGFDWLLTMASDTSQISNNSSYICGQSVKTIIRLACFGTGEADNCSVYSDPGGVITTLKNLGCDVYVTAYNEAPNEFSTMDMQALANKVSNYYRDLISAKESQSANNVHILSPSFDVHNQQRKSSDFIKMLNIDWTKLAGIAVNAYNTGGTYDGDDAYTVIQNFKSSIPSALADKIYVTETGDFSHVTGQGIPGGYVSEYNKMVNDSNIKVILFFNVFGLNPDAGFAYGIMTDDEVKSLIGEGCYSSGTGTGEEPEEDFPTGCCQYNDDYAIKQCATQVLYKNGTRLDFNEVNSGVKMVRVSELPTDDANYDPNSKNWEFRYAIVEQIHNFPLAYYLAASQIEGNYATYQNEQGETVTDDSSGHTIMTHSAFLTQLNFQKQKLNDIFGEYYNYGSDKYAQPDFTNQFEGIAESTLVDGSSNQLAMPSLGNIAGYAPLSWVDYYEIYSEDMFHCGFFYDKSGRPKYSSGTIISESDSDTNVLGISSNKTGQVLASQIDEGSDEYSSYSVTIKKWQTHTDYTGFTNSAEELQDLAKSEFLGLMNQYFGTTDDPCKNQCAAFANEEIDTCDYSDTILLPKYRYEIILASGSGGAAPMSTVMTPEQICNEMFNGGKVVGGTCTFTDGFSIEYFNFHNNVLLPDSLANLVRSYLLTYHTGYSSSYKPTWQDLYNFIVIERDNAVGKEVTGDPYWSGASYPATKDFKLQGLLKDLETVYELESIYNPGTYTGRKICHYNNVGINIVSTRKILDAHGDGSVTENNPDFRSLYSDDDINFHYPPNQVFKIGDRMGDYGSCTNTKTQAFSSVSRTWSGNWSVAKNIPSSGQGMSDYSNSEVTVSYIIPWIGQIPRMWERLSYGELNYTNTTLSSDNPFVIPDGTTAREHFREIYYKEDKSESEKVVIPYCEDAPKDDTGTPTTDCYCSLSAEDPLEEYLRDNGMLTDSFVNGATTFYDGNGNGIPDDCEEYMDDPNPTTTPVPTSTPPESQCTLGSIQDGIAWPMSGNPYVTTKCGYVDFGDGPFFHPGLDLGGGHGSPVYATEDGEVIYTRKSFTEDEKFHDGSVFDLYNGKYLMYKNYGNMVAIQHADGVSMYAHMLPNIPVDVGNCVKKGDLIGYQDNTGNTFGSGAHPGSHLHFEVRGPNSLQYSSPSTTYCPSGQTGSGYDPSKVVPFESFGGEEQPPSSDSGNSSNNNNNNSGTMPDYCEQYIDKNEDDVDDTPDTGSTENFECLLKKVANTINTIKGGEYINAEILWAITFKETGHRCSLTQADFHDPPYPAVQETICPKSGSFPYGNWCVNHLEDQCSGNPNEVSFIDPQRLDGAGKGLGGFMPNTFRTYMNMPEFQQCVEMLEVDTTQGLEGVEHPGDPDESYIYTALQRANGEEVYSRLRSGDTLCAMALKIINDAGNKPLSQWTVSTDINTTTDTLYEVFYHYSGRDIDDTYHYHQDARRAYFLAKDFLPTVECTAGSEDKNDVTEDGLSCPLSAGYINQWPSSPLGSSHTVCEYRRWYNNFYAQYSNAYKAVDIKSGSNIVYAPADGTLGIIEPAENPYDQCDGAGTPYDGGWIFTITSGDKIYRLAHVRPDDNTPDEGATVKAGDPIGILFDGIVASGSPYNYNANTNGGCFSPSNMHTHLTILNGDVVDFVTKACSNAGTPATDNLPGDKCCLNSDDNVCNCDATLPATSDNYYKCN